MTLFMHHYTVGSSNRGTAGNGTRNEIPPEQNTSTLLSGNIFISTNLSHQRLCVLAEHTGISALCKASLRFRLEIFFKLYAIPHLHIMTNVLHASLQMSSKKTVNAACSIPLPTVLSARQEESSSSRTMEQVRVSVLKLHCRNEQQRQYRIIMYMSTCPSCHRRSLAQISFNVHVLILASRAETLFMQRQKSSDPTVGNI